jgi:hypothetical protein
MIVDVPGATWLYHGLTVDVRLQLHDVSVETAEIFKLNYY